MANVRGMGVAVITNMCGGCIFFDHNLARCATPKRCCSSITTNPKFLNSTVSSISACVPMRIWSVPFCNSSAICARSFFLVEPVSNFTFTPILSMILCIDCLILCGFDIIPSSSVKIFQVCNSLFLLLNL